MRIETDASFWAGAFVGAVAALVVMAVCLLAFAWTGIL